MSGVGSGDGGRARPLPRLGALLGEDRVHRGRSALITGLGAYGYGDTKEEALADLRAGLVTLIEEFGIPDETTLTLNVALFLLGRPVPYASPAAGGRLSVAKPSCNTFSAISGFWNRAGLR